MDFFRLSLLLGMAVCSGFSQVRDSDVLSEGSSEKYGMVLYMIFTSFFEYRI